MRRNQQATRNDKMAMRILWPNLPAEFQQIARDAVGSGFETEFYASAADVSDEQWANADAIVGSCPPQYIDKLRKCRIFVKYGVGYDGVSPASLRGGATDEAISSQLCAHKPDPDCFVAMLLAMTGGMYERQS
jgi:hypothetical protein